MDLEEYYSNTKTLIDRAMEAAFPREIDQPWLEKNMAPPYFSFNPDIWRETISKPFYDLYDRGGKRIRPVLTCLTHDALRGENPEIYTLSLATEILHSGSLIVDDIEDNSTLRRGQESIHLRYGHNIALNCAGFCYFYGQLVINNSRLAPTKKQKISDILLREMCQIHYGQAMDLLWSNGDKMSEVDIPKYLQMASYKTGTLVKVAVAIGGVAAKADDYNLSGLYEIATPIGVAFQIEDDIKNLTMSGDKGKVKGEDITEGKLTYLVIDTLKKASMADRDRLIEILAESTKDERDIDEAIGIMSENGTLTAAHEFAKALVNQAQDSADRVLPDTEYKPIFLNLLESIISSEHRPE